MAAKADSGSCSNKGGYDYEFVTPPPKSLECSICLLTLRDPHVISCCGNEFCQVCIECVKRDNKPCPLCNEQNFTTLLHKKLVREVNALVIYCPQKELGCDWKGELGKVYGHLYPEHDGINGCGYVIISCSYDCGMQLQRQKLREHKMEICPKRPVEMQVASLLKKFEAMDAENKLLQQELGEIKEAHKKEIKEMKSTYEGEINQLKESQKAMKFQVQENSKVLKGLEEECNALENHKVPLSLPPYYFNVLNADRFLECNTVTDFDSAPFYSHPGGYKMHINVQSNEVIERGHRNVYLEVYVSILRGEFDDQLKWPFDGEVTVQAYNRTLERWDKERKIQLNMKECELDVIQRQIDILSSTGWGYQKWLSSQDMKSHFVKDTNTLRLRVVTVKVNSIWLSLSFCILLYM